MLHKFTSNGSEFFSSTVSSFTDLSFHSSFQLHPLILLRNPSVHIFAHCGSDRDTGMPLDDANSSVEGIQVNPGDGPISQLYTHKLASHSIVGAVWNLDHDPEVGM